MSAVVGIDLGTTNTVVAHVEGGRATAIADENGDRLIPSVVSFHPSGSVIVGKQAKERRLIDARNTVYSIKRLIGRTWGSEDVKRARERAPFELREGPGHAVLVVARGETYTLSEISAYVLRKAKAVAEAALGQTVSKAVITVPANFNDLQRAATKVAGRVAGLEVLRILNEPTAAALAYGYGKSNSERVAVYDFGGGTFDMTLLDLSGNVFEVLATAGDTFLGGDDVDLLIADKMCEAFLREHRYDPRTDPQVFERVRAGAEDLKHALSKDTQAGTELKEVTFGPGGRALGLKFSMTRVELDRLIAPLVERTFNVCRDALTTARLNARDFDQVIVVGGSTRIPLVRQRVAEFFGREPLANISPDEVVAIGAAIQGMALTQGSRRDTGGIIEKGGERANKVPTLGGLGEAAQQAQQTGATTARGVGGGRSTTQLGTGGSPIVVPAGGVVGAPTERAPSTADFGPSPIPLSPDLTPPPQPTPGPAAGRKPSPPAHTKLSASSDAREAIDRVERESAPVIVPANKPGPIARTLTAGGVAAAGGVPQAARPATTDDSVMASLPLVGAGISRREAADALGLPTVSPDDEFELADELTGGMPNENVSPDVFDEPTRVGQSPLIGNQTLKLEAQPPPGLNRHEMPTAPPPPDVPAARPPVGRGTQPMPVGNIPPLAPMAPMAPPPMAPPPMAQPAQFAQSQPVPGFPPAQMTQPMPQQPAARPPMPSVPQNMPAPRIQEMAPPPRPPMASQPKAPVLVDVTPLSLCVETVGGYCDVIITRNTPIPCDGTRVFVTAQNHQRVVKVRVAQGENARFQLNTVLGELELSGIREGLRGEVEIAVTFEIDTDGLLQVRARDVATGREAQARMRLVGAQDQAAAMASKARQDRQMVV